MVLGIVLAAANLHCSWNCACGVFPGNMNKTPRWSLGCGHWKDVTSSHDALGLCGFLIIKCLLVFTAPIMHDSRELGSIRRGTGHRRGNSSFCSYCRRPATPHPTLNQVTPTGATSARKLPFTRAGTYHNGHMTWSRQTSKAT